MDLPVFQRSAMSATSNLAPVGPSEVARRLDEYRKLGFERRAPAQVVYKPPFVICPWSGCGLAIDGIRFQLELWLGQVQQDRLLDAWWNGPGLVGQCPKCGRYVLYGIDLKAMVAD